MSSITIYQSIFLIISISPQATQSTHFIGNGNFARSSRDKYLVVSQVSYRFYGSLICFGVLSLHS